MSEALARLRQDPCLAPIVRAAGPFELSPQPFDIVFEPLARSVIYQQLSGKAAGTIYGRFVDAFGDGERPRADAVARADPASLRAVGLSRRKVEYVQALALAECEGRLPSTAELAAAADETIIEALTAHRGIGRWTVEMLLMFWLARPDVFPVADLGIRKGMAVIDGLDELPDAEAMLIRAEAWRPFRTTAAWYLWRAAEGVA